MCFVTCMVCSPAITWIRKYCGLNHDSSHLKPHIAMFQHLQETSKSLQNLLTLLVPRRHLGVGLLRRQANGEVW